MNTSKNLIGIVIFLIVVVIGAWAWTTRHQEPDIPGGVACTMEAKICPDGSAVGRVPPSCDFAPCPPEPDTTDWVTYTDSAKRFSFRYPAEVPTKFMSAQAWPPTITIATGTFGCTPNDSPTATTGRVTQRMIGDQLYCVEAQSEGAAGSTYITYRYTTALGKELVAANFVWREVQCANYDDPAKTDCEQERTTFNLNTLIDQIVATVVLLK